MSCHDMGVAQQSNGWKKWMDGWMEEKGGEGRRREEKGGEGRRREEKGGEGRRREEKGGEGRRKEEKGGEGRRRGWDKYAPHAVNRWGTKRPFRH